MNASACATKHQEEGVTKLKVLYNELPRAIPQIPAVAAEACSPLKWHDRGRRQGEQYEPIGQFFSGTERRRWEGCYGGYVRSRVAYAAAVVVAPSNSQILELNP